MVEFISQVFGFAALLVPLAFIHCGLRLLLLPEDARHFKVSSLHLGLIFLISITLGVFGGFVGIPGGLGGRLGDLVRFGLASLIGHLGSALFLLAVYILSIYSLFQRAPIIKKENVAVLAIVLLALAMRLIGINWGNTWGHIDEGYYFLRADRMLGGDFNLDFFEHPTFLIFSNYAIDLVFWELTGHKPSHHEQLLLGRVIVAIYGTLTVLLLYFLGKQMYGRKAGLLGAFFLAVSPLHVVNSHYFTFDTTYVLWMTACVFFCHKAAMSYRFRYFVLAGLMAGLSSGSKYTGMFCIFPLFIANYLGRTSWQGLRSPLDLTLKDTLKTTLNHRFIATYASAVLAFAIVMPYAWLKMDIFIRDWKKAVAIAKGEQFYHFLKLPIGYIYHFQVNFPAGLTMPVFICAILGMIAAILRLKNRDLLLLAWWMPMYANIGKFNGRYGRYVLGLLPPLCIFAAMTLLGEYLPDKITKRKGFKVLSVSLIVLFGCYAFLAGASYTRLLYQKDVRWEAREWMMRNIKPREKVGLYVSPSGLIIHDKPIIDHIRWHEIRISEPSEFLSLDLDWVVMSHLDFRQAFRLRNYANDTSVIQHWKHIREAPNWDKLWAGKTKYQLWKKYKTKPTILGLDFEPYFAPHDWYYIFPTVYIFKNTGKDC